MLEVTRQTKSSLIVVAISESKTYSLYSLKQTTQIGISLFKQNS